jgi:conjugal transfer pilus assembly protein TraL
MATEVNIPTTLDDPMHFLLWSSDEVAPIALGLVFGALWGQMILCLVLGFLAMNGYRRFRDGRPDGFILHVLYRVGVIPSRGRTMPNPWIERFFP